MGSVSVGGHLEISRECTGETVLGACIGELRRDRGSWYVVRIERAGRLAFGELSFNLRGRSDARHAGQPWECRGVGHCHDG